MALEEQIRADRPPGIAAFYGRQMRRSGDSHRVLHRMMECLAETPVEGGARPAITRRRDLRRLPRPDCLFLVVAVGV
ncbi:MAG: DUF1841 family protein, partial [Gammaproteobacteria bacterium]